jgi:hypothetical protein
VPFTVFTLRGIVSGLFAFDAVGLGMLAPARHRGTAAAHRERWRSVRAILTLYGIACGLLALDAVARWSALARL